jgi:uncharacterized membrane protein YoaT (DUF817 family)
MRQVIRFGVQEALSCIFAVSVFAMLAISRLVHTPIPQYDLMLLGCLAITALLWWSGIETSREVAVIGLFHLVGLALELFKVRTGSWAYPGFAYTKIGEVPLYSGFMYAAVGSYLCQAWRRLDLDVAGYRPVATALVAGGIYANFFLEYWLPDLRLVGAAALLVVTRRTRVSYRVGTVRYTMPLALAFALIGAFLWFAENIATIFGAWRYPDQGDAWRMVHLSKFGSWALLVSVSFVLVAALKHRHHHRPVDEPSDFDEPVAVRVPARVR